MESVPREDHFLATESAVYLPMSAPKKGIRGRVSTAITAEVKSKIEIVMITAIGVIVADISCGRKRPKYVSSELNPLISKFDSAAAEVE